MPKMKTRRSAAKRYRVTSTGKVKHATQGKRHILTKKNPKRKRQLRQKRVLAAVEQKRARTLLPYAF